MAQAVLDPAYRRIRVDEFLALDLRGAPAELDDGLIRMLAGATEAQARVSVNLLAFLGRRLRGSGWRAYGFGLGVRTGERTIRFPSGAVYRHDPARDDTRQLLGDPAVVIEVCSPHNRTHKQAVKLTEYRTLLDTREIGLVDPFAERIDLARRTPAGDWRTDQPEPGADLVLHSIGTSVPHAEIFAAD